jgi:hypothetical protein
MIESLSQGPVAPQLPATPAADPTLPTPAQSDNHKTPPEGTKSPDPGSIEPQPRIKPPSSTPKPNHAREPKNPKSLVGGVRWSQRLDKQGKSSVDALFSADSPLTDLGTPLGTPLKSSPPPSICPPNTGNESVLHSSSTLTNSLGKRKRGSGVSKSRKKGAGAGTSDTTTAKAKTIVRDDESDQSSVMVCSPLTRRCTKM